MDSRAENQHTVQKALLLGFADSQGYLRAHYRSGEDRRVSAKRASVVPNFYSFRNPDGSWNDSFDRRLQILETTFGLLRDELQSTGGLGAASKTDFDRYVAFAMLRTRTVRSLFEKIDDLTRSSAIRAEILHYYKIDRRRLNAESLAHVDAFGRGILNSRDRAPAMRASQLRTVVRTASTFQRRLRPVEWRHIEFHHPVLITSDAGVAPLRTKGTFRGLFEHGETVVVPLGPQSLALGSLPRRHADYADLGDLAKHSNQSLAVNALDELYRHPDMDFPGDIDLMRGPVSIRPDHSMSRRAFSSEVDATAELLRADKSARLDPFSASLLRELDQN